MRLSNGVELEYPEYCIVTVKRIVKGNIVSFKAKEYWIENYAKKSKDSRDPNQMWFDRPRGQLAKCAEAQALRKGFPESCIGITKEEMEGKHEVIRTESNNSGTSKIIDIKNKLDQKRKEVLPQAENKVILQLKNMIKQNDIPDEIIESWENSVGGNIENLTDDQAKKCIVWIDANYSK